MLTRMESDLESGSTKDATRLYCLYSQLADMGEIDRVYPDKIRQIISISNLYLPGKKVTTVHRSSLHLPDNR